MKSPHDLVVFDLDGTLLDSADDLHAALDAVLAEEGRRGLGPDELRGMIGDGAARLVQRAFAATGGLPDGPVLAAIRGRFLDRYARDAVVHTRPYPGVVETLDRLAGAGWRFAVCTNKPQAPAEAVIAGTGLARHLAVIVGGDRAPAPKPDPAHVLAAVAAAGATPARAVMVGDSGHDIRAGAGAGLATIAVSWGYGRDLAGVRADRTIDRFDALPAALAALAPGGRTTP